MTDERHEDNPPDDENQKKFEKDDKLKKETEEQLKKEFIDVARKRIKEGREIAALMKTGEEEKAKELANEAWELVDKEAEHLLQAGQGYDNFGSAMQAILHFCLQLNTAMRESNPVGALAETIVSIKTFFQNSWNSAQEVDPTNPQETRPKESRQPKVKVPDNLALPQYKHLVTLDANHEINVNVKRSDNKDVGKNITRYMSQGVECWLKMCGYERNKEKGNAFYKGEEKLTQQRFTELRNGPAKLANGQENVNHADYGRDLNAFLKHRYDMDFVQSHEHSTAPRPSIRP